MIQPKAVAAGDSWNVELLFHLGTGGGIAHALFGTIMGLNFPNIAHAGDSTEETMGLAMSSRLKKILPGSKWLLFSGGGDDFAGDMLDIFLNDNKGGGVGTAVNLERLNAALDVTIADYQRLTEIRDQVAPDCLIITHSYDYPPAKKMGQGFLTYGPWLKPSLDNRGWTNPHDQEAIVKIFLKTFQGRMSDFAKTNRLHLHVDTQGCCQPQHWANELHLNEAGCLLVAERINAALALYTV